MTRVKLNNEQIKQLLARYETGENVRLLVDEFSISVPTLYKLVQQSGAPTRSARRRHAAALKLTDACLHVAAQHGGVVQYAAKTADVSARTMRRILQQQRAGGDGLDVKRGRPTHSQRIAVPSTLKLEADPALVDETSRRFAGSPFPYPQPLAPAVVERELHRLKCVVSQIDEHGTIQPWCPTGTRICAPYFPNRYAAVSDQQRSALDAWHKPTELARAIRFQLRRKDPVTPKCLLRAVTLLCRTPTIFRPVVTRFLCERYCPPGGTVWDPCAGYGGRLLGAYAAGVHYVGTDVEPATVEGNRRLAQSLGYAAVLHCAPAETFAPPRINLVLTSPPYFNRERYSTASAQSWRRYATFDAWVFGFLRPVITRAYDALYDGGHLVLNVANLRVQGSVLPLVEQTIATARAVGFAHIETLRMPLAAVNRRKPTEPVLVFRK